MRVNISGCTNSCGQHHISDIGFFGLRAPRPTAGPRPATRCCSAATSATMEVEFGGKAAQAAGQDRTGSRRAHRRPVRRRTRGGRDVPDVARTLRRRGGRRRDGEGPRPLPHPGRRRPTSTSTTTRPVPTSPKSATASARRHDGDVPMTTINDTVTSRPLVDVDLGELAAVTAELEHQAGERRDQVGIGALRLRPRARGVVPGLRADRHRGEGRARDRGRVPRHAVPLRGDALVRRPGP